MNKVVKVLASVGMLLSVPFAATATPAHLPSTQAAAPIGFSISDANKRLYRINMQTGAATVVGTVNYPDDDEIEGLASVGGTLYGVGEANYGLGGLYNITTVPGRLIGQSRRLGSESGAAYNRVNQTLYAVQADDTLPPNTARTYLYRINRINGQATFLGFDPNYVDGLAITNNGVAYGTDFRVSDSLYRVNLTNGVLTRVGPLNIGATDFDSGAAIAPATGVLYALREDGAIYTINTATGQATFRAFVRVGGTRVPGDLEGLDIPVVGAALDTGEEAPLDAPVEEAPSAP